MRLSPYGRSVRGLIFHGFNGARSLKEIYFWQSERYFNLMEPGDNVGSCDIDDAVGTGDGWWLAMWSVMSFVRGK